MSNWLLFALGAVIVIRVIARRLVGEPLNAADLVTPPIVLLAIGIYSLSRVDHLTGFDTMWIVIGALLSLFFGALRGSTTRLFARDGVLWQRYTWRTFIVWVLSLAVNGSLGVIAVASGMHPDARPITLSIGVGLFGEMVTVGLRALVTGAPFAADRPS